MDCNKEDAIKARDVAEGKMLSEDYLGAKKFILKSQRLFPTLGGLTQMLTLVDVHISAGQAGDELSANWHQILQVEEFADEETVRKQYRKLLLLLHPDKNKYPGAESAFKLVQSAHDVFEKGKELAKASVDVGVNRRFWAICTECMTQSEHLETMEFQFVQCPQCLRSFMAVRVAQSSQSKSKEEFMCNFQRPAQQQSNADVGMEDELKTKVEPLSSSSSSFEDFERRRRRRRNVGSKRKPKLSSSTSPEGSEKRVRQKSKQGSKGNVPMEKDTQAGVSSRKRRRVTCPVDSDTDHSFETSPLKCHMDSPSYSKMKDGCLHGKDGHNEETSNQQMQEKGDMQGAGVHFEETSHHERREPGCMQGADAYVMETSNQRMKESGCVQGAEVHLGDCSRHQEDENAKDDAKKDVDPKVLFFQKLQSAIMNEFKSGEFQVVEVRQDNLSGAALDAGHGLGPRDKVFQLKMDVSFTHAATSASVRPATSEDCMVGGSEIWEEEQESVQCAVPDSDVFKFDNGREEGCFEAGQIWAIYDDDDGLPRFYAHITEVISVHPFHVCMKWLYPAKTVSEEVKAWTKAGFAYTCGEFTIGKKRISRKKVRMFSHIMAHETGGVPHTIRIYPQKGDVWALYMVWKPCKGRTRKCEAVVVLSHYSEEVGVQVATLFKVDGYTSIFCRKGTEGFRNIPASELSRFSHQIPAHYLIGNEVSNLPDEECVDLDTAAFI